MFTRSIVSFAAVYTHPYSPFHNQADGKKILQATKTCYKKHRNSFCWACNVFCVICIFLLPWGLKLSNLEFQTHDRLRNLLVLSDPRFWMMGTHQSGIQKNIQNAISKLKIWRNRFVTFSCGWYHHLLAKRLTGRGAVNLSNKNRFMIFKPSFTQIKNICITSLMTLKIIHCM